MHELTIVSPHRDDVPFSLYQCLSRWRELPIIVKVVTVFTISTHAPGVYLPADLADDDTKAIITSIRKREDDRVFRLIDKAIRLESLHLLDAPLRLGVPVDSVCSLDPSILENSSEVVTISHQLRKYFSRGLVLAPLGLGNHIDHLTVNAAAIKGSSQHKLGFYEDLPYATAESKTSLRDAVSSAERDTGMRLKPLVIAGKANLSQKRRVISLYQSQIDPKGATEIARFASNYRGGERIWVPEHSRTWNALAQ